MENFNLLQLETRPNWYQHLDKVESAMRESDRVFRLRSEAGWVSDEGGFISPDGITESDWEHEYGFPFPEEKDYESFAKDYFQ